MSEQTRQPVRVTCGARCGYVQVIPLNPGEVHQAILYASCPKCGAPYSVERLGEEATAPASA